MADFIEPLLINFLFILLPIFVYHIFSFNYYVNRYKYQTLTVLSAVSIIICMEFSIEITAGYYYDLRFIPLILSVLYGGYRVGTGVVFVTLIYRYIIGGQGFFVSLALFLLILVVVSFASKKFKKASVPAKIFTSVSFSIFFNLLVLLNFMIHFGLLPISQFEWAGVIVIQIAGTALTTYIIEVLRKTIRLQQEAAENERLKVVSSLAASIAHEVRNPLTVTKGFLQLLKENKHSQETKEVYINFALQELDSANEIITDYLTFAKPEIEKMEKVDVSKEITNCLHLLKPLTNMNNILVKVTIEGSADILGDSIKLHQCFINIIKNSVDSLKERKSERIIEVVLTKTKEHVEVAISDNGMGMTKEQVSRLGTPYFSTKEQGTGLGLMVVFSLIRAMKGKVKVTSEKSKGTKVKMIFPLLKETKAAGS